MRTNLESCIISLVAPGWRRRQVGRFGLTSYLGASCVFVGWLFVAVAVAQDGAKNGPVGEQIETLCQDVSISPPNRSFTAEGGSAFINVEHESGCTFVASSNASWIRITSLDDGTVYYSVRPNVGPVRRTGTISVGSQNFYVYQGNEPLQGSPSIVWTGTSHTASANAVAFSPNGQLLASASSDHTVKVWRAADGALLRTLTGFYDSVTSVAFSHNGQTLVAGSIDRNLRVWNVADWSLVRSVGTTDFIFGVAFSPDDTELAAAGGYSGNWIHLFRTSDWEEIALLGYGQEENRSIAYSNDGQFLGWAMLYPGVRLQNVGNGSYCILEGFDYYGMNAVAFSPDSHRLATGSDSQEVGLWDVTTCAQLLSLNGPSGFVKSVAYAPNSQMILAGGQDYGASRGTLLFWRIADGALLRAYVGETSTAVLSVQYSPRGKFYAYSRADGGVVVARNPFSPSP
jgi:WD40 repeat protein